MKALNRTQAAEWCEKRGVWLSERDGLAYGSVEPRSFVTAIPRDRGLLGWAAGIALNPTDEAFEGGLVYVRSEGRQPETWDYFHGLTEATFGLLRQSPDWRGTLERFPGQQFGPGEASEALAFVTQLLLFSPDGYFVPHSADYIAEVSHDEVVSVHCRDALRYEIMLRSAVPVVGPSGILRR